MMTGSVVGGEASSGEGRAISTRLRMNRKKDLSITSLTWDAKVYENGRVAAHPETLRLLATFSEPKVSKAWCYTESQYAC